MASTSLTEKYLLNFLPGRYIVAVSGGVDSMVLLDLLRHNQNLEFIVAHVNHGIREDSKYDQELVAKYCMSHNIRLESKELDLGKNASEETARKARYAFLQMCRDKYNASAIITAHHQDDLLETAVLNIMRGTGWRGLASLRSANDMRRPLLDVTKEQIIKYAKQKNLNWREDYTNLNQRYLRNYVRHTIIPNLNKQNPAWRSEFLRLIRSQHMLRRKIMKDVSQIVNAYRQSINNQTIYPRYLLIMLPSKVAREVLQAINFELTGTTLLRRQAEDMLLFIKTARPQKTLHINDKWQLRVTPKQLIVEPSSSVIS